MNEILDFFSLPENYWYLLALKILLVIFALELITFFMGGIFNAIDNWLDLNFDLDYDFDIELPQNVNTGSDFDLDLPNISLPDLSLLDKTLHWLNIGKVPLILYLTFFLSSFSLVGFQLNHLFSYANMSSGLLVFPVIIVSVFITKFLANKLGNYLKPQETLNAFSYLGKKATVYDVNFTEIGRVEVPVVLNRQNRKEVLTVRSLKFNAKTNSDEINDYNESNNLQQQLAENQQKINTLNTYSFNEDNIHDYEKDKKENPNLFKVNDEVFIVDFDNEGNFFVVKNLDGIKKAIQRIASEFSAYEGDVFVEKLTQEAIKENASQGLTRKMSQLLEASSVNDIVSNNDEYVTFDLQSKKHVDFDTIHITEHFTSELSFEDTEKLSETSSSLNSSKIKNNKKHTKRMEKEKHKKEMEKIKNYHKKIVILQKLYLEEKMKQLH